MKVPLIKIEIQTETTCHDLFLLLLVCMAITRYNLHFEMVLWIFWSISPALVQVVLRLSLWLARVPWTKWCRNEWDWQICVPLAGYYSWWWWGCWHHHEVVEGHRGGALCWRGEEHSITRRPGCPVDASPVDAIIIGGLPLTPGLKWVRGNVDLISARIRIVFSFFDITLANYTFPTPDL